MANQTIASEIEAKTLQYFACFSLLRHSIFKHKIIQLNRSQTNRWSGPQKLPSLLQ